MLFFLIVLKFLNVLNSCFGDVFIGKFVTNMELFWVGGCLLVLVEGVLGWGVVVLVWGVIFGFLIGLGFIGEVLVLVWVLFWVVCKFWNWFREVRFYF